MINMNLIKNKIIKVIFIFDFNLKINDWNCVYDVRLELKIWNHVYYI